MIAHTGPHGLGWKPLLGQGLPALPPEPTGKLPAPASATKETEQNGSSFVNGIFILGTVTAALVLAWTIVSISGSSRE